MDKSESGIINKLILAFWCTCFVAGLFYIRISSNQPTQYFSSATGSSNIIHNNEEPTVLGLKADLEGSQATVRITTDQQLNTGASNLPIEQLSHTEGVYEYQILINDLKLGANNYNLKIENDFGATIYHPINIYRDFSKCDFSALPITTISNPDSYKALVDKYHKIPEGFVPTDMTMLSNYQIPTRAKMYMRYPAAEALNQMTQAIKLAGHEFTISSAWRTDSNQQRALDYWTGLVGRTRALNYAALPGHSEHQLGTAIDILSAENNFFTSNFEKTRLSKWLIEHAHEYGFVMSYPKDKQHITGYNYEPWHYRFVGTDIANELRSSNVSLTEYLYEANNVSCN